MEEWRGSNESGQALSAIILLFVVVGLIWTLYSAFTPPGPVSHTATGVGHEWLPADWRVEG